MGISVDFHPFSTPWGHTTPVATLSYLLCISARVTGPQGDAPRQAQEELAARRRPGSDRTGTREPCPEEPLDAADGRRLPKLPHHAGRPPPHHRRHPVCEGVFAGSRRSCWVQKHVQSRRICRDWNLREFPPIPGAETATDAGDHLERSSSRKMALVPGSQGDSLRKTQAGLAARPITGDRDLEAALPVRREKLGAYPCDHIMFTSRRTDSLFV